MPTAADFRERYLATVRRLVLGASDTYPYRLLPRPTDELGASIFDALAAAGIELVTRRPPERSLHEEGGGWPVTGQTMVGEHRLLQLQRAVEAVVRDEVEGDLIEAGVWRGGAAILMRAVLETHGVTDRTVFVADSFAGLPPPDAERYPADDGDRLSEQPALAVPVDEVRRNFDAYGLLDDQVRFVEGWFRDTLPGLRGHPWAVIRLDGDLYESTIQGLENLYPSLSEGGFAIVDDYGAVPGCKAAVRDFRRANRITEPLQQIDWTGFFWRKGGATAR